ncbi:MAG: hypothetical protein R2756_08775 [Bacteroidales bacterium]
MIRNGRLTKAITECYACAVVHKEYSGLLCCATEQSLAGDEAQQGYAGCGVGKHHGKVYDTLHH